MDLISSKVDNFQVMFGDNLFGFGGFGGMNQGGHGMPRQRPRQDAAITHELPISLEDLNKGCTKKMKITRLLYLLINTMGIGTGYTPFHRLV